MPYLLSLLSFLTLLIGINRPLTGQHDWNSVYFGNAARNHLRAGLLATKLGVMTNYDYQPGDQPGFYVHHPPLMSLLIAANFLTFGIKDYAVRLTPVFSATIFIFFLFRLTKLYWDQRTAIFTSLVALFSPILIYYSKVPIHETLILGFLAMTLYYYLLWHKTGRKQHYWLLLLSLILSQLTSWAGYYLSLYLPLHSWFFRKRRLVIIFLTALLMFLLFNLHIFWLRGASAQNSLLSVFLFRSNLNQPVNIYGYTFKSFLVLQARWLVIYFTRVTVILSLIWLALRPKINFKNSFVLLLLIFGFTHNAIFRMQAFIHDYTLIYALPFFALSAGIVLNRLSRRFWYLVVIIFVLLATERLSYLQALFRSGNNNPSYSLGLAINRLTQSGDKIAMASSQFMEFNDIFVQYYADRNISALPIVDTNTITPFNFLVIPQSHDYLSQVEKLFLYSHFPHYVAGGGIIFKLKS